MAAELPEIDLRLHRVAITEAQIAEFDLPTKPRKESDKRRLDIAEAMPARLLRDLLRRKVESYLPPGALAAAQEAERSEQEGLEWLADKMGRGTSAYAAAHAVSEYFDGES